MRFTFTCLGIVILNEMYNDHALFVCFFLKEHTSLLCMFLVRKTYTRRGMVDAYFQILFLILIYGDVFSMHA